MTNDAEAARLNRFADRLSAMGTAPRLRILRLLLSAHPVGMVVTEIQAELGVPGSSLSHHLEKLKHEGLLTVKREGTYLRYTANVQGLHELLEFLFEECCTRNQVVPLTSITSLCGLPVEVCGDETK